MSTIKEQWQQGHGLPNMLVIDGHGHIGEWPHGTNFDSIDQAVEESVAIMDAYGVDATCVLAGGYMFSNGCDYRLGNDFLLECVNRAPERLIPFACINPNDNLPSIRTELERMYSAGVRAIKLWNQPLGYPGDGPHLMAVYEFAQVRHMLVLNHQWADPQLRTIAAEFPELVLIRGHGGASKLTRGLTNVYDNIWNLHSLASLEQGILQNGPEKVLFGSDAFMNDPAVGIGMVVYADIPDEHKRMILGLNMAQLLDRAGALPQVLRCWLH